MGTLEFWDMLRIFLVIMLWSATVAHAGVVLVFGDSLSAGYGLPRGSGWVDLLERRLEQEKYDYTVVNASLSGETTGGGRTRIAEALARHKPEIVVLALGANDGLRGARVDTIRSNLSSIIAETRKRGAKVLLVGMQLPPNYGIDYVQKFRDVFAALAESQRVALVPFLLEGFAEKRSEFLPDGVHPAASAQAQILDTVWKELRPLLSRRVKSH
jgi:acyl-CoA thioesterase-1